MSHARQVEAFSNEQALEQVRLYWANHGDQVAAGVGGRGAGSSTVTTSSAPRSGPTPPRVSVGASPGSYGGVGNVTQHQHQRQRQHEQYMQHGAQAQVQAGVGVRPRPRPRVVAAPSAADTVSPAATLIDRRTENAGGAAGGGSCSARAGGGDRQHGRRGPGTGHPGDADGAARTPATTWREAPPAVAGGAAQMKSCRVAAGPPVVDRKDQDGGGNTGHVETRTVAVGGDAGGAWAFSSGSTRRPLIRALHEIAKVIPRDRAMS